MWKLWNRRSIAINGAIANAIDCYGMYYYILYIIIAIDGCCSMYYYILYFINDYYNIYAIDGCYDTCDYNSDKYIRASHY